MASTQPRFICDHMLGTLAKWLRLLGYDTLYPGPLGDKEQAATAYDEGRILLTRDKTLAARVKGAVFVASDDLDVQLRGVVAALNLDMSNPLSLCSVCDVRLEKARREDVRDRVPPAVYEIQTEFWRCPTCSRVYWRGTHFEDMLRRIRRLEGELGRKS